jgi:hypothetical protein
MPPLVSVVMPTHNRPDMFTEALAGLWAQYHQDTRRFGANG